MIDAMSGGRLQLEVYSSNELVPDMDAADAIATGVIDMALIHWDQYSGTVPSGAVEQIPFLWKNTDEKLPAYFVWGVADAIRKEAESVYDGLKIVGWTIADPGAIIFKDEFETLADLKGRIINVDDPMASILRDNFGLSITFFPPEEIYTALALGTLDGTEYGSEVAMTAMGLEEVAKYLMLPHYQQFWAGGYSVNQDKFEALPDDLQAILEEGLWAMGVHMRTTYDDMIITEREKMLKAGVTFVTLPDADIAALSRGGLDAMDDIAAQSEYAAEAVQIIRESLAKFGRG
jgi:TRAP-type C4-dicarboxylate transport system substrate-binding protein